MKAKLIFICALLTLGQNIFARSIKLSVNTTNPKVICKNTQNLVDLMSPYIDLTLTKCDKIFLSSSLFGDENYNVEIEVDSSAPVCKSEANQAILFDVPTNTYPHWNPPVQLDYINTIIEELGFKSGYVVSNLGPTSKPKYKQIVLIPECSFK